MWRQYLSDVETYAVSIAQWYSSGQWLCKPVSPKTTALLSVSPYVIVIEIWYVVYTCHNYFLWPHNVACNTVTIRVTFHERHGVYKYQRLIWLFNSFHWLTAKKTPTHYWPFVRKTTERWILLTKGPWFGQHFAVVTLLWTVSVWLKLCCILVSGKSPKYTQLCAI